MWRYTPCPVKFGPFDGRLFIILLASFLFMPVIGHWAALGISATSLIMFWLVEQFGLDVNMVFRWLRCWVAGNYQTAAGARFDTPRRRLTTLPMIGLVVGMAGHYPDTAMADFRVTDTRIADKPVTEFSASPLKEGTLPLKEGEHGVFVSEPPCKTPVGLTEYGVPPGKIVRVSTRGNNIPLRTALKAILPKGWHANKTVDVDGDLPLSWEKGEEFTVTLSALAEEHHLSIQVSWINKKVKVMAGCDESPPASMAESALGKDSVKDHVAALDSAKPPALPPPPPKPTAYYMLRTGQQMSDALREWCDMANKAEPSGLNWTVKWEAAKEQPIEADSFYGNHIEDAISKLQETIIGNNLPFRVVKWPNHVIKVTN